MHTLLLRLAGPMQSWGIQSRFPDRDTGLEPSKSGVIGLLCAALGKPRDEDPHDDRYPKLVELAALEMGVRMDRQGTLLYDYHTAQKVRVASATDKQVAEVLAGKRKDVKGNILRDSVSSRWYLSDAAFLVGFGGDDLVLLRRLHAALRDPHWPLYLGRKAFVPSEPVWLDNGLLRDTELEAAFKTYRWLGCNRREWENLKQVRVVWEDPDGSEVRSDRPLSFAERRFAPRRVRTDLMDKPPFKEADPCTSPD
jgi:CRISPR system Cascade subunit CasD